MKAHGFPKPFAAGSSPARATSLRFVSPTERQAAPQQNAALYLTSPRLLHIAEQIAQAHNTDRKHLRSANKAFWQEWFRLNPPEVRRGH